MRKFFQLALTSVFAVALLVAKTGVSTSSWFFSYQPEAPKELTK